jgi:hypothetical protein
MKMSDKTFKDRINEELPNFQRIYKSFSAARKRYLKRYSGQEGVLNEWYYSFDIPFESSGKRYLEEHREGKQASRHDFVINTIRELELDELYLGGFTTNGNLEVLTAVRLGLLEENQLHQLTAEEQQSLGIRLHKPDRGDPIFWRTLLEILCRAYVTSRGRKEWPMIREMDLALDIWEISEKNPAKKLSIDDFHAELNEGKPYKAKYPPNISASGRAGVGEDRIKKVLSWMAPLDDEALSRLRSKDEVAFLEVFDKRWGKPPQDIDQIKGTAKFAVNLADQMYKDEDDHGG